MLSQAIEGRLCRINGLDNGEQYGIIGGYPHPALYVNDDTAASLGMVDGLQDAAQALLLHALLESQCCRLFQRVSLVTYHLPGEWFLVGSRAQETTEQQSVVDDHQVGAFRVFTRTLVEIRAHE